MKEWTISEIADRFKEAVRTLRRLPPVRKNGYFNTWPAIVYSTAEVLQMEVQPMRLGPPPADAISRMEETIDWIFLLDTEEERRIIWLRAARVPWRPICYELGCKRTTAHQKHKMALCKIESRLNTKRNGGRNG
jgi:hypothetical protein